MRFFKSYMLAFLIILGIAAWMISGTLIEGGHGPGEGERPLVEVVDAENGPIRGFLEMIGLVEPRSDEDVAVAQAEEEPDASEQDPARSVRFETFEAQDMPIVVNLRGRTQANAVIAARAETTGVVKQVHVTKGQTVASGDLLCTLDQGTRQARVATAEAQFEQAQADLENNIALRERGVAPANTARQFEVALRAAQADYDEAVAELERTEIHAEVSGIVQDPLASIGDSLSAGTECATIVQLDPMLFIGDVAEARVEQLSVGEQAMVTTVTGSEVPGEVRYVASRADPDSRTFTVEIAVPNADNVIRDGVTAEAFIEVESVRGHLVPQSVLTLEADGSMGVRVVEQDNVVAFYPIEILRDTREGLWVTGLPDVANVITVGQEYVQSGQIVTASRGDGA